MKSIYVLFSFCLCLCKESSVTIDRKKKKKTEPADPEVGILPYLILRNDKCIFG